MLKLDFQSLMNEATRLTRAGNLKGAAAAIRSALRRPHSRPADDAARTIDVEMREVGGAATAPSADRAEQARVRPRPQHGPGAGRFVAGHFANSAGGRDYKLYIPPGAGDRPLPLLVMLHGCTQDPDDFAAGTQMNEAALAQDFLVLYPAQSRRANPQRCWNWFKHNHQARGRGEPALLAGMTRDIMARHAVDPDRIYAAGLSAGGAMAAILGDAYPDLYAAVGIHSGLPTGAATDLFSGLAAMKSGGMNPRSGASGVATIVFHGDADATVHHGNAEQIIAATIGASASGEGERLQDGAGRSYTRRVHRAPDGRVLAEYWLVHGASHAWSGGSPRGSYTDAQGPDASVEMVRFFFEHPRRPVH